MIYALVALALLFAISWRLFMWGKKGYDDRHSVAEISGMLGGCAALLGSMLYFFMVLQWIGADQKAKIINREYGTNYTQSEVFYASDVIDTIRQIDRRRIEVNGDLMCEKSDKR